MGQASTGAALRSSPLAITHLHVCTVSVITVCVLQVNLVGVYLVRRKNFRTTVLIHSVPGALPEGIGNAAAMRNLYHRAFLWL